MAEEKVLNTDTAPGKSGAVSEESEEDVKKTAMKDIIPTLLQQGTDVTVSVSEKNILHRLRILKSEKKFTITPIKLGTLYKISHILLDLESDEIKNLKTIKDEAILELGLKNIVANKDKLIEVVGLGLVNCKQGPTKRLLNFLNDNITVEELLKLTILIVGNMDITRFLACTVSAKKINLLGTEKN